MSLRRSRGLWVGIAALVCGLALAMGSDGAFALPWAAGIKATRHANANPDVVLGSVSCDSPGNCSAVGSYTDRSRDIEGLLLSETGGRWARGVAATLPAGAGTHPFINLKSVSCASGSCSAIGQLYTKRFGVQGLLLTKTGGRWAPGVKAAAPANAAPKPHVVLQSLSCGSAGNCSAVGHYLDSSDHAQGLLLSETGGRWARGIEAVLPTDAGSNPRVILKSVSCPSAGSCSAVGHYLDSSDRLQGLLLSETGGSWARGVKATLPADARSNLRGPRVALQSVSCASAGNCSAIGSYTASSYIMKGLLLSETGARWARAVTATLPADAGINAKFKLPSVSCGSAGNCSAVGSYTDSSGHYQGLLLTETAGTWSAGVKATPPAGTAANPDTVLGSVSCGSAGRCSAVGYYTDSQRHYQGLLLSETAGSWAAGVTPTPPAGAASNPGVLLDSVSCPAAGNCSAVGNYYDSSGHQQGLLLGETHGTWAAGMEAMLPADAR